MIFSTTTTYPIWSFHNFKYLTLGRQYDQISFELTDLKKEPLQFQRLKMLDKHGIVS